MARFIVAGFAENGRRGASRIIYDGPDLEAAKQEATRLPDVVTAGYVVNPQFIPLALPAKVVAPVSPEPKQFSKTRK